MSIPVLMQPSYPIQVPDISDFQNYTAQNQRIGINYALVKAANPSVRAVIIKAAEGDWPGYDAKIGQEQAVGFLNVGLPVIPYSFWHDEVPPADQARRLKTAIANWGYTPKQAMVDIEDTDAESCRPPTRILLVSEYPAWCKKAKQLMLLWKNVLDAHAQSLGFAPFWYSGEWYQGWAVWLAGTSFDGTPAMDMSWLSKYKLHCASYTAPWMYLCTGFTMEQTILWQWTSTAPLGVQLTGFPNPGSLDMNYWLKSEAEFNTWIGAAPVVKPPLSLESLDIRIAALEKKAGLA